MGASEEIAAIAKISARKAGRAVRIAAAQHVEIDRDAFILAPLKMAGEDAWWAAAYGERRSEISFVAAGDPRNRDDEAQSVLQPLSIALEEHFRDRLEAGRAPQILVTSPAAVKLLDALGDRRNSRDPFVALLGRHAWFLSDRFHHDGQQVLLPAVDFLLRHFATGQSLAEDQHLGALLAWIEPPKKKKALDAASEAEDRPAGVSTDVEMDIKVERRLRELAELRREKRGEARQSAIVAEVKQQLKPFALDIVKLIEQSTRVLGRQRLPIVKDLPELRRHDQESFEFYRDRGFIPGRFSAKEDAQRLAKRESMAGLADHVALESDRISESIAQIEGDVLEGRITGTLTGGRVNSVQEVEFETVQIVSRFRVGDIVRLKSRSDNITLQLIEGGAPDTKGRRYLKFRMKSGKTFVARYRGKKIKLFPTSYSGFDRSLMQLKEAHDRRPWILTDAPVPPASRKKRLPRDPLKDLEKFR